MTCFHEDNVLRNMTNVVDPAFKDSVQVAELDWEHTDECAKLSDSVDVVIGADIVSFERNLLIWHIPVWYSHHRYT